MIGLSEKHFKAIQSGLHRLPETFCAENPEALKYNLLCDMNSECKYCSKTKLQTIIMSRLRLLEL